MITQKIKRWLDKLFAWWPWRRSPETTYAQAISNMNSGVTQESMLRNTVDGPLPQIGNSPVAIEQGRGEDIPELSRPTLGERPEYVVSSHSPTAEDLLYSPHSSADEKSQPLEDTVPPLPTPEQKLAFLQYLVKRGIINEGFDAEHLPRQYKNLLK